MNSIKGFTEITASKAELVNRNKNLEEILLRVIEELQNRDDTDKRCLALAFTGVQDAFMWMNRGVFKPERLSI